MGADIQVSTGSAINNSEAEPSTLRRLPSWVIPSGAALAWCLIVWVIYRPFTPFPFDVIDFPEFLPLLRKGDSFGQRLTEVTQYFFNRGRASVGTYAMLVLNYELWAENTVGWQLTRVFQLTAAGILLFVVLRRWGSSTLGASMGTLLLTCARSAAPNWQKLVASESLGLVVILITLLIATGFRESRRTAVRTTALCVLVALLVVLKEVWAAALPGIWAVAYMTDGNGRWSWVAPARSQLILVLGTAFTALACLVPVVFVAVTAPADSYASLYGSGQIGVGSALVRYLIALIPFVTIAADFNAGVLLSDIAFLVFLGIGWRLLPRGSHRTLLLVFGLSFPMLGVLSYLPWPNFWEFYSMPYVVGTAVLVAFASSGFAKQGAKSAALALALWMVPFAFMLTSAHYVANQSRAVIALSHQVTNTLSEAARSDTVIFAVQGVKAREWFGPGAILTRQASLNGQMFPPFIELDCTEAKVVLIDRSRAGTVVVSFDWYCRQLANTDRQLVQPFWWFDWARGRVVKDSVSADVFNLN